ncbi:hypothetical protein [Nostoc sp. LEGE 06077]|nr:hypothetical protein [Nostoc sp. LEGE 06077]
MMIHEGVMLVVFKRKVSLRLTRSHAEYEFQFIGVHLRLIFGG